MADEHEVMPWPVVMPAIAGDPPLSSPMATEEQLPHSVAPDLVSNVALEKALEVGLDPIGPSNVEAQRPGVGCIAAQNLHHQQTPIEDGPAKHASSHCRIGYSLPSHRP